MNETILFISILVYINTNKMVYFMANDRYNSNNL